MTLDGVQFSLIAILGLLLILVPLVLLHELGHFITARLVGIRVLEFGLGFPPRARVLGHDHETEYTLNYLPIGGFVRLEGEESDSDDPRAFGNAGLLKQVVVLVAGVTMNLITAVVLLFIVAWAFNPVTRPTIAVPSSGRPVSDVITPSSPADQAGLKPGDTLVSINGQAPSLLQFSSDPIGGWKARLNSLGGQTVTLAVADTAGTQRTVQVQLHTPTASENWALGAVFSDVSVVNTSGNPIQAAGLAVDGTVRAMSLIAETLGNIVTGFASSPTTAPAGVQGPLGIAADVGHVATQPNALMLLLMFMAVISANLALVNVLPLPALDGGKVLIMVLKRLFGVRGVGVVEQWAYVAGFAFLLMFIGWITYFDIVRGGTP